MVIIMRHYMYVVLPRHIPTDVSSTKPKEHSKQVMMASSWDDGTHSIQLDGQADGGRNATMKCTQNIGQTLHGSCAYDLICITIYMHFLIQIFLLHNYALIMIG